MLKQILLGGLFGGITLFMWGFVSWAVMDWHHATVQSHEGVHAVVENIGDHLPETGVYYFPPMTFERDDTEAMDAWVELHRAEPHGMIFYNANPGEPMPPTRLLRGFMVDIIASMMASVLLVMALPSLGGYWQRVIFVLSLGIFAIISIHLVQHVFHDMPISWTSGQALDTSASWFFAGLALAGIIKNK
ncbi:MAG: hypothetical protein H8E86_03405 [Planctomycetes bacterium]|nr:hypothetical protein [Planctomycetota bacterium]